MSEARDVTGCNGVIVRTIDDVLLAAGTAYHLALQAASTHHRRAAHLYVTNTEIGFGGVLPSRIITAVMTPPTSRSESSSVGDWRAELVTPAPQASTMDPDVFQVEIVDSSSLRDTVGTRVPAARLSPLWWLPSVEVFVPRSIREPFLGDLREDLADMAARGQSSTAMLWAVMSQVALLILRSLISVVTRR